MDESSWSSFDNSSIGTRSLFATDNATTALPTTWTSPAIQDLSTEMVATVGLVIFSIGVCANSVVLAVLVRARRHFGSSVHTFIANQSAMDLFACVCGMGTLVMMVTHGYNYNGNEIVDGAICVLFEGIGLTGFGSTSGKMGLIVITVERYFKIVHAIAHRKYYRNWMTKVGVALPWIFGACLILIPSIAVIRIVNGQCVRMGVWPNEATEKVRLYRPIAHASFLPYLQLYNVYIQYIMLVVSDFYCNSYNKGKTRLFVSCALRKKA